MCVWGNLFPENGFRLFQGGHFNNDAGRREAGDVFQLDNDNGGLEVVPGGIRIEPRLDDGIRHGLARFVDEGVDGLVGEELEVMARALGFVLVFHDRESLAVARGQVVIPAFAVFVVHVFQVHAKLGGDEAADGRVVVGIDDADFAGHLVESPLSGLSGSPRVASLDFDDGGAGGDGDEAALRAVGFEKAEHFKLA